VGEFERHIKFIFSGPLKEKSEEEQISFLLIWVGEKGQDISQAWAMTEEEKRSTKRYGYLKTSNTADNKCR